jgi:hypothetical protein
MNRLIFVDKDEVAGRVNASVLQNQINQLLSGSGLLG